MNSYYIIIFLIIAIILTLINIDDMKYYYRDVKYLAVINWQNIFYSLLNKNLLDKPIEKINKIAIVTFENRKSDEYIDLHNKNIKSYCEKWNYDYLF